MPQIALNESPKLGDKLELFPLSLLVGFTVLASQNWFEHQAALQQAATLHNASLHKVVSMFSPATVPPLG